MNWLLAFGMALTAFAIVTSILLLGSLIEGALRTAPRRLRRVDWLRGMARRDRAWVCGAVRIVRTCRASTTTRRWPGAGIISCGLRGFDPPQPNLLPGEGEWLKRTGPWAMLKSGDALAGLILLFFGVFPIIIVGLGGSDTFDRKLDTIFLLSVSTLWGVRWLVAVGALLRGWFDAHIDAGAIEFAGPRRTDSFERQHTMIFLNRVGPFVDTTLVHRSGRRARFLLTNHGARKILSIWGNSVAECASGK